MCPEGSFLTVKGDHFGRTAPDLGSSEGSGTTSSEHG
jgi:hypothetical protein